MTEKEPLYTTKEACEYLRVHRHTLRKLRPAFVWVGARKRYRRADLDKCARRRPHSTREAAA